MSVCLRKKRDLQSAHSTRLLSKTVEELSKLWNDPNVVEERLDKNEVT